MNSNHLSFTLPNTIFNITYKNIILENGTVRWQINGILACNETSNAIDGPPISLAITTDTMGGAIITWDNGPRE